MALNIQANLQDLVKEIRQRNAKKVMIQLPEGLRTSITAMTDALSDAGIESVVSADPSYGACDLADYEAKQAGCDMLVHVGHNKFYVDFGMAVPVLYYPWTMDVELGEIDLSVIKEKESA